MTLSQEAQAVAEARNGSAAAFARLVADHQQAVRAFLRRLSGSYTDADDLAQETFVTAWTRIASFRETEGLRAWLCGIAYRKWMTGRRGEARRRAREAAAWREESLTPATPVDPSARLDAMTLLRVLPPEQRAVIALCLAAGMSHSEAALALKLPLGTVKTHLSRGRARLLHMLGGADEDA